jgi:hypothetical protein
VRRYTFVVQVHPDGVSTLENLSTSERVPIGEMAEVGGQIDRWLAAAASASPPEPATDSGDRDRVGG